MTGSTRKNENGERITHFALLNDDDVKRWYENIKAGSSLTAGVYLRGMGFYCNEMKTTPKKILEDAKEIKPLQNQFMDFVRMMEKTGRKGAYIARYKKVLHSWTKHNGLEFRAIVKIKNENVNERTQNESIPTREELAKILRHAGLRAKVEIALMAFSGLRPRSMSNDSGSDCLNVEDIPELRIDNGKVEFEKEIVRINVRTTMNKGEKHGYTTFLGPEGQTYLKEYLEYRISEGEALSEDSPVLQYDRDVARKHTFIPTNYIEREIRSAIRGAGLTKRPYVLRAYFATALDISEQKGLVSHPWRQYWMGHVGNIESRYSTNKRLSDSVIEEMRQAYGKCLQYLETEKKAMSEQDKLSIEKSLTGTVLKKVFGFTDSEIEDMLELDDESLQKRIQEKIGPTQDKQKIQEKAHEDAKEIGKRKNGSRQVMVPTPYIDQYFSEGFEYVAAVNGDKAIMRLP